MSTRRTAQQHWTRKFWVKKQSCAILLLGGQTINRNTKLYDQCSNLVHLTGIHIILCLLVFSWSLKLLKSDVLSCKNTAPFIGKFILLYLCWMAWKILLTGSCSVWPLTHQINFSQAEVQLGAMVELGGCRGWGKRRCWVCTLLLILLSLSKESLFCLLRMPVFHLFSQCPIVLEIKHLPGDKPVMQIQLYQFVLHQTRMHLLICDGLTAL